MSHTYYKNHVHVVFHTGRRTIKPKDLERLHAYIGGLAKQFKVQKPIVGGTADHIHMLGEFPLDKAPSQIVGAIKAVSSRWIKGLHSEYGRFSWQQGFGYFSVSSSERHKVVDYIKNQAEHHKNETAAQEYARLIRLHYGASGDEAAITCPPRAVRAANFEP